ncbi:MAG: YaaR family protein [Candidatus Caenarcaniphilales bacterium]|nr:YaaR family protein [Candidatus Caenarcaniphilales bacterium]
MVLNPLSSAQNTLNDLSLRSNLSQMAGKLNNAAEKIDSKSIKVDLDNESFQKVIESKNINKQAEQDYSADRMRERLADIRKIGAAVKKYFTPGVMTDYLGSVHSFLEDLKDNAYQGQSDPDGLFEKLNIVNEELDDIGTAFLKEQKDELRIAASLDLIEGILVDVMA